MKSTNRGGGVDGSVKALLVRSTFVCLMKEKIVTQRKREGDKINKISNSLYHDIEDKI